MATTPIADSPCRLGPAVRVFCRHPSVWILCAAAFGLVVARLSLSDWSVWDLVVGLGILLYWPLNEWLIHVFVLHFEPFALWGRRIDLPVARMHRAHHRDPWNLDLVWIPLHAFAIAPLVLGLAWLAIRPDPRLGLTGLAVYFLLSLHYEWVHFLVHTRCRPTSRYYRKLWRNHRLHHCKNENYWFGVTMLGGDRLLRTAPDPHGAPLSPTCYRLEQHDDLGVGREPDAGRSA